MSIMQTAPEARPAAKDFRARNNLLFARRQEILDRLTALRTMVAAGEPDIQPESAMRRAEREFEDVMNEIIKANLGLVQGYVAMFTSGPSTQVEDFESAGKVGLLWAISSYDPARGSFANWAFKPIQREVLRAVRDADHPNLNFGDFEKRPAILAAERACLEEAGPYGRTDYAAVAERAGVTEAQVHRVLSPPLLETLNLPAGDDGELWEDRLADSSPSIEDRVLFRLDLSAVEHGLSELDARERYVLARRFGLNGEPEQSLRIIGQDIGLSGEGVRLIERKALAKLAEAIADTTPDDADDMQQSLTADL
ncbi:sigma-70 family RNA polymerase sigma factor [Actinomadura madurae]|uniref:sigma-70 family RNA polymerase sigma factor n=1 Tax=Actinomadura madurae TaxID=1993 RepID=UPI0020266E2B|nr:sigma-70 family RNA polymerase sigma factor [Actinomadura madurae]URM99043.1 sigma-70 family RNA polymerase sigma factor [Actinomadura madurae]